MCSPLFLCALLLGCLVTWSIDGLIDWLIGSQRLTWRLQWVIARVLCVN